MHPEEYFQQFLKREIDMIQRNMVDMAKFWDSKIVKLREDMNIHGIVKRIGEKADASEVQGLNEA